MLLVGITLAQGPKKDIGNKVPLPPVASEPQPASKDAPLAGDRQAGSSLSIDVDLVNVDVVVTDKDGNPIGGLEKRHFKVFDNNVEQKVTNFSPSDAPLTVVVIVEFGDTILQWYEDFVGPAAGFINSLRPEDWGALVAYDIRPEILVDFTKDKRALFDGLNRLRIPAYREICLYDAVYDTLKRMENVDGKKAIFLISSGLDTISKHNYPETLKKAEASDTVIYSVSIGQYVRLLYESRMGPEESIEFLQADNVMRSLAEATGGTAFFPRFQGQFGGIYETVSAHLRNQYSIGFAPSVRATDGKFRKLRVEVDPTLDVNKDGKPDKLKVKHKKGYLPPKT